LNNTFHLDNGLCWVIVSVWSVSNGVILEWTSNGVGVLEWNRVGVLDWGSDGVGVLVLSCANGVGVGGGLSVVHLLCRWDIVEEWKSLKVLVVVVCGWDLHVVGVTADSGWDEFLHLVLEEEQILRCHLVIVESVDHWEEVPVHHLLQVEFLEEVILDNGILDHGVLDEVVLDKGFFHGILHHLHRTLFSHHLLVQHLVDWVDQNLWDHFDVLDFNFLWLVEEGVLHHFVHVHVLDVHFLDIFDSEDFADDLVVVVEVGHGVRWEELGHPVDWSDKRGLDGCKDNWEDVLVEELSIPEELWEDGVCPVVLELRSGQIDLKLRLVPVLTEEGDVVVDAE